MNFKTTIILIVLLLLFGGYYLVFEVWKYEKEEKKKEISQQVLHFESDSVSSIKLKNLHGEFEFEKTETGWQIRKPVSAEAEKSTITSALSSLKNAKKENEFSVAPAELKDYGLDARATTIRISLLDGSSDSLRLGDKTPVGTSVFSAKTDTMVFTVPQTVKTTLDKKLFDWRFKKMLQFAKDDVQRLVVHTPKRKIEFQKKGPKLWEIVSIKRPAQRRFIDNILNKLRNTNVKAFVDEEGKNLKKYGLTRKGYKIELFLGPQQGKKTLFISRRMKNKYYARDDSRKPVFEIDSTLIKEIDKSIQEFRSKDMAIFESNDINKFIAQFGDTTFVCVKDTSGDWYLDEPGRPKLKEYSMRSFLTNLEFSQIEKIVSDNVKNLQKYGLDRPQMKAQLFKDNKKVLEIRFGNIKDDQVYAMTDQYDSIYLITKSRLNRARLKREEMLLNPAAADTTQAGTN